MEWHPRAKRAPANKGSGPFIYSPPKIVLHTVEGRGSYRYDPASYYGNPYWPHATIDGVGIHQHLPIDVYGFALANAGGGVETNRAYAIQCEILWSAAEIGELPDDVMANLADWVGWVADQTGAPLDFAEFRGDGSYGEDAPQRFTGQQWLDFSGICGHQHVPENDHWDPGAFPVDRLRALLGAPTPTPPTPVPEEPDVAKVAYPLEVRGGQIRKLPILAIGGGFDWRRASVTFGSAGVDVRRAIVGPNERPIAGLAPEGIGSTRHFAGRGYVDLQPGDEWIEITLDTGGTLDLYVEAADGP